MITPLMAVRKRAISEGFLVLESTTNDPVNASLIAQRSDIVIFLGACTAGESEDRPSLVLDGGVDDTIPDLAKIKPTIVLMQAPGTIFMPWHKDVQAAAILFLGGEHTGSAWEAVVFGDVSPSGKLPLQIPSMGDQIIEPTWNGDINYTAEGIFTSYRAKFNPGIGLAVFPFGHGLSYTNFTFGAPVVLPEEDHTKACSEDALVCVQVPVTNSGPSGSMPCTEVAQAYVEFPAELDYPKLMLKGFYKTAPLVGGASETAIFNLTARDLSVWNHGDWQLQRSVTVHVGASSADLRGSVAVTVPAS